jgi:hypothetical protein
VYDTVTIRDVVDVLRTLVPDTGLPAADVPGPRQHAAPVASRVGD